MLRRTTHARAAATLAWTVAGFALACIAVTVVGALLIPIGIPPIEAIWVLSWIGFPLVGAVLVSRRPDNRVGWLLLAIGLGIGVGQLTQGYAAVADVSPGTGGGPLVLWAVWWVADVVGFTVAFGVIPLLLLCFPDGRPTGRADRWLVRIITVLLVLCALSWVFRDQASASGHEPFPNPLAPPFIGTVAEAAVAPIVTALVACAVAAAILVVLRFRRAVGIERLQLRWFALAAAALPVLLVVGSLAEIVSEMFGDVADNVAWVVGFNGIAVAIGIAVLRYRLYEIDRVVSRTVTYAVVTALLIAVYAVIAVLPSVVFDLRSDLLVAVATLAAAGVFVPLRRRVQARVDRRFNRSRYDALQLVDGFGVRVRNKFDVADLLADLGGVVAATVQPTHVSLWAGGLDARRSTRR